MASIVLVYKDGTMEETSIKTNLYITCNYRNDSNFELLMTYSDMYEIYGKRSGKCGTENKYEFPDAETYYGNVCIVKKNGSLTIEEWNKYLNNLNDVDMNDNELLPEEYDTE